MAKPDGIPEDILNAAIRLVREQADVETVAREIIAVQERAILAERQRCAAQAGDWLKNWASDLSDTRDAYIEAQATGTFSGRRMSRANAIGFATVFRERSEAVFECADELAAAIRSPVGTTIQSDDPTEPAGDSPNTVASRPNSHAETVG